MVDAPSSTTTDLSKKLGPLPIWGWALGIGGGLGLWYYYKNKNSTASTAASTATGATDGGSTFGTTNPGVGNVGVGGATDLATTTALQTNQQWSVKAQNYLVAEGFDPVTVANALASYLNGQDLSSQAQAIVSEALRAAGPTPEPVPTAANSAPTPVPVGSGGGSTDPLYSAWWAQTGQAATDAKFGAAPVGQVNWGQIAASQLGPSATLSQVEAKSLQLQQDNPAVAASNPFWLSPNTPLNP